MESRASTNGDEIRREHYDNLQPQRLNGVQKLRKATESSSLKSKTKSSHLNDNNHNYGKSNSKHYPKSNLQLSAQKLKLTKRQCNRNGPSSTNTNVPSIPSSSKEETSNCSSNKYDVKSFLSERNETPRCGSKRKTKDTIEIEIFMPVIDTENNVITYPNCKKPIVKIHSAKNKVPKKNNVRENSYFIRKNKKNVKKLSLYLKPKKDIKEKSLKNVSNPTQKGSTRSAIKKSVAKKESSKKNLKQTDAPKKSTKFQDLEKIIGTENVNMPEVEKTSKHANVWSATRGRCLEKVSSDILYGGSDKNFSLEDKIINEDEKLPMDITCNVIEECNTTLYDYIVESGPEMFLTQIDELDEGDIKWYNQQRTKLRDPMLRNIEAQLYLDHFGLERRELTRKSLNKIRNNERGWRRPTQTNSLCSDVSSYVSKWRRKINDDGRSMESWIERSKYLQSRNQSLQMNIHTNKWRPK